MPHLRSCSGGAGSIGRSVTVDAAVDDANAVAHAQVVNAVLHHGAVFAVIHADIDLVLLRTLRIAVLFHIVTNCCTGDTGSHGGCSAAAAATDLVAGQCTDHTAQDGAGAARAVFTLCDLDRIDHAVAGRGAAAGIVVAAAEWLLAVAGATGEQGASGKDDSDKFTVCIHIVLLTKGFTQNRHAGDGGLCVAALTLFCFGVRHVVRGRWICQAMSVVCVTQPNTLRLVFASVQKAGVAHVKIAPVLTNGEQK